jgi:DNA-binding winged helix-turn-helix (wHTH) protein
MTAPERIPKATNSYSFGPFEVELLRGELRKFGIRLQLERKPWQLLLALLEHPGATVSRSELSRQMWGEGVFVDFEHGLNVAVKKLREVLGDSAETPRYVETVVGQGYRFIAPVVTQTSRSAAPLGPDVASAQPAAAAAATQGFDPAPAGRRPRVRWLLPAAAIGVIAAALLSGYRHVVPLIENNAIYGFENRRRGPSLFRQATATTSLAGTMRTVTVPGTAGPWDAAVNPGFDYTWSHDYKGPVVIGSGSGFSFSPGSTITVTYVSGTISAGAGYPFRDANGDPDNLINAGNGDNGKFPGFYMNRGLPVYGQELVGAFANNGVIVGQPFAIGDGPATLTVPAGANQLQLGINDNLYSDNAGVFTVRVSQPSQVCLLYDPLKAAQRGSTIPIKLQLCDASGNDLSSSAITLHATGVTQVANSVTGPIQTVGSANPDDDFRFDSTLGSAGGYILNLSTRGLATGSYNLNFTMPGDPFAYAAPFQVK